MRYLRRHLEPVLRARLRHAPVVVVTGARQTGKSTLVQRFLGARRRAYRTLDDVETLDLAQHDTDTLVAGRELVTIDEIQRAPALLLAIKRDVDRNRRSGRFLLTGSANLLLMERISESLAGRAQYLTLWPLSESECRQRKPPSVLAALILADGAATAERSLDRIPIELDLDAVIVRGGYPPAVACGADAQARTHWLEGFVQTYLERDLQQLARIDALPEFRRLMRAAALRTAQLVNQADLARDAGISPATAYRYLNLLETSYQIHRLPAYAVNRTKRLIKAPKLHWTDTGLACFVAGLDRKSLGRLRGSLAESWVVSQLLAWRETVTPRPEVLYWRTAGGEEVDIVLEWRGRLLPIEVKTSMRPGSSDARSLESFVAEYPEACRFGLVLYPGDDVRRLSANVLAVPLAVLV